MQTVAVFVRHPKGRLRLGSGRDVPRIGGRASVIKDELAAETDDAIGGDCLEWKYQHVGPLLTNRLNRANVMTAYFEQRKSRDI